MRRLVNTSRRLEELSREENRSNIYKAYLGEDYDGIGQYVLVTLARTSTSAGVRARVASGDFGTGQVIPVGTQVAVFVNHGLVEILSMGAK